MKVSEVKAFVSTDRKVHVALTDGGSKDGFLSLGKTDGGKTIALVKGDRGRPATVALSNIDTITWHGKEPAARKALPTKTVVGRKIVKVAAPAADTTCSTCGHTFPADHRHTEKACSDILAARPKRVPLVKKPCGCSGKLLCKQHYQESKGTAVPPQRTLPIPSPAPDGFRWVVVLIPTD